MDSNATQLSYSNTGYYSSIVADYVSGSEKLRPFYNQLPTIEALKRLSVNVSYLILTENY